MQNGARGSTNHLCLGRGARTQQQIPPKKLLSRNVIDIVEIRTHENVMKV
jgi:hypothetical protein